MIINVGMLLTMGVIIFTVHDNDAVYYGVLGSVFVFILVLNFKAGLRAIKMVLKKESIE